MKTIGLRLNPKTLELINQLTTRNLGDIEKIYGIDFSDASLLIRVSLGNLLLNHPSTNMMEKIITSIKDDNTFYTFLHKIWSNELNKSK
jgi:hypothetical protein